MQDKTLFIIALAGSVLGLGLLFVFSKILTLAPTTDLEQPDGRKIAIIGTITESRQRNNVTLMTISHTCTTTAVIFDNASITAKDVRILGTLSTYKGKKEIIVEKIEAIAQEKTTH
jgi:hypothetical protein